MGGLDQQSPRSLPTPAGRGARFVRLRLALDLARCAAVIVPVVVGLCVATGCSSGPPSVDPAVLEAEEARLSAPFAKPRTIVCERLSVSLSPNFPGLLTIPVPVPGVQSEDRVERDDGGTLRTFTNGGGGTLDFAVDKVVFKVLEEAQIEVLGGRAELTLEATTEGDTWILRGDQPEQIAPISISDGAARS